MDWFTIFEEVIKNLAALNDEIKEILSLLTLLVQAVTKKKQINGTLSHVTHELYSKFKKHIRAGKNMLYLRKIGVKEKKKLNNSTIKVKIQEGQSVID